MLCKILSRKEIDISSYVWYASYGSNIYMERFLCYIRGGVPPGSTKKEKGCRDKTLPKDTQPIDIPYPLYFTKQSKRWGGGVAFIGHTKDHENLTLGRMYLITKEQFIDVLKQENDYAGSCFIDFKKIKETGKGLVLRSWYGTGIYIGDFDKVPIFTFTAYWDIGMEPFTAPSNDYLRTIALGLIESHSCSNQEIVEYLISKPGIQGNFTKQQLIFEL
jgi:hypothetical protein